MEINEFKTAWKKVYSYFLGFLFGCLSIYFMVKSNIIGIAFLIIGGILVKLKNGN